MNTATVNPSGRLIHYCRETGKMTVLMDQLFFANGVVLSPNEDFVVVAETFRTRLMRYWLKGEKKGQWESFVDGIPGAPDNLSSNSRGILVTLATSADTDHPMLSHTLAGYPTIRKFLSRFFELFLMPFKLANSIYPNPLTNFMIREFGSTDMLVYIVPKRRTIIRLDWNGNIIKSYHGDDDSSGMITHAVEIDNQLYLGSVVSNYIARVNIKNSKK